MVFRCSCHPRNVSGIVGRALRRFGTNASQLEILVIGDARPTTPSAVVRLAHGHPSILFSLRQ
jgi:hypothetical protein